MTSTEHRDVTAILSALDKIALELVFAEADRDFGLLPVNSLVMELEDQTSRDSWPAHLVEGLRKGRLQVDAVLEAGSFSKDSIEFLRIWVSWMQEAARAVHDGRPAPEPRAAFAPSIVPALFSTSSDPRRGIDPATEVPLLLDIEKDADLLREFTQESLEHLQIIELGVLTLEENPTDSATLDSVFRAFHTFKGGSGFLNLRPIHQLAHELESLLDLARQRRLEIDSTVIDLILSGRDTLKHFIVAIDERLAGRHLDEDLSIPTGELIQRVQKLVHERGDGIPPTEASHSLLAGNEIHSDPAVPGASSGVADVATREDASESPADSMGKVADSKALKGAPKATGESVSSGSAIKVDTSKLDSLVDLVGEMVIAQSLVHQDPSLMALPSPHLRSNLAQLNRITKELQRLAMSLRMVPIGSTFQKMARLVRDLGVKAGKQVELHTSGEDTDLDRTIVEKISDPLIHMVRNAVDHGIESPEDRVAAGKSAAGRIDLRAFHQGGNIVVEIRDDGAGLDRDRILKKAIQNGLVSSKAALSDAEISALIFAPGFSTAERVTDLSGRGVGMDVVRRNVEKLRGKIEVSSVFGKGSRFTIRLPLTLAIIDGMIVGVGNHRYILPTLSVRESFRPTAEMLSTVRGRAEVLQVRGRLLPLLRLHSVFGTAARATNPLDGIVIVVESDGECRCVLVDDLLGKQEVVIKSLGDTFKDSPLLSGAAILGDGRVGLILDVGGLLGARVPTLSLAA